MSTLVATTIDDDAEEDDEVREIPLPNVKDAVLTKVIEYCTHYKDEPMTPIQTPLKSSKIEEMVQPWYANFVKVDQALLFELVTAANFMDIKPLLDLTCLAVSVLIKVRSCLVSFVLVPVGIHSSSLLRWEYSCLNVYLLLMCCPCEKKKNSTDLVIILF